VVADSYGSEISEIGRRFTSPTALVAALEDLPGWGPVTTGLFLRELRGVWPGAVLPLDSRAAEAARHLGLLSGQKGDELGRIVDLAEQAHCDTRDLETGLVRLSLDHRRVKNCPGRLACVALTQRKRRSSRGS
jgi:hypothetical protein